MEIQIICEYQIYNQRAMYYSDEEVESNPEENDFEIHYEEKAKKPLPNLFNAEEIARKCWLIHQDIIEEKKNEVSDRIIEQCNQFCGFLKDGNKNPQKCSSDEEGKEDKQEKEKKRPKSKTKNKKPSRTQAQGEKSDEEQKINLKTTKLIIPICIRKSQQQYLEQFGDHFFKRLSQLSIQGEESSSKISKYQFKILIGARKVNVFCRQFINEVSRIALYMHKKVKEIHIEKKDISIYFSKEVTNLSPENLYILEEGLPDTSCITIIPTYSSFEQVLYNRFSKIQIIPIRLFEHKTTFAQFMYNCICDPDIKAYLPKESIKLIDDFDDFPITYKEGSRRLIHCITRLQVLRQRNKTPFRYVELRLFFKAIEKALKKVFGFFHQRQRTITKYVKSILDEGQSFNILDRYLNKHSFFRREELGQTEIDLVVELRGKLIYYIQKQDSIKQYSAFLKNDKINPLKKRGRQDKDMQRLKIDPANSLDEKGYLEYQMRDAITCLTNQIRKQARQIRWEQYYFMEQIKPMLPYNIFNSVKDSRVHKMLLDFIYSNICTPLSRLIDVFCIKQNMKYGELMYYMKDLEMYGLIDVSESTLKPIITPAFFDKASYKTRKQG